MRGRPVGQFIPDKQATSRGAAKSAKLISPLVKAGDSERMTAMRRAMRVMTACVLSVGVLAVVAQADRPGQVRDLKGSAVTFHKASSQPAEGLRKETMANGQVVYVSPAPVANSMEIIEATTDENGTTLRISGDAVSRLGNQVAMFIDDKLASVGPISQDGQVTLGRLSADQADRISRIVQPSVPVSGPTLTLVPAGQRDGLYLVDVFVQGADDLRIYQVSLLTGGGTSGRLQLENVIVDQTRPDYVFGAAHIVEASSPRTGLLAAVLYDGSVKVTAPKYLGTYAFRPTTDASGTFRIGVNMGEETLLADGANEDFNFSAGADARITIGRPVKNQQ